MSTDKKKEYLTGDEIPRRKGQRRYIKTPEQLTRIMGVINALPFTTANEQDKANLLMLIENLPDEMITPEGREALAKGVYSLPFVPITSHDKSALLSDLIELYRDVIDTPYDVETMQALKAVSALESVGMDRQPACKIVAAEGVWSKSWQALEKHIQRDRDGFYKDWLKTIKTDRSDITGTRLVAAILIYKHSDKDTFIRCLRQTPDTFERFQSTKMKCDFRLEGASLVAGVPVTG